jgi:hypothetical protein
VNDQYTSDYINIQKDNQELRKILTVINGCVLETRNYNIASEDKNVSHMQNTLNDLYSKVLEDKSHLPNSTKHKVLLIGDSHLREYSINIKKIT